MSCRWLESKSRFWPDTRLRPDVGPNGWLRTKLVRAQGRWELALTYVDWVGRERLRAALQRPDGGGIAIVRAEESEVAAVGAAATWRVR